METLDQQQHTTPDEADHPAEIPGELVDTDPASQPLTEPAGDTDSSDRAEPVVGSEEVQEDLAPNRWMYVAQSGDTLAAVARRFSLYPGEIRVNRDSNATGLLTPGELLVMPVTGSEVPVETQADPGWLLPDSEIVYGPSARDFDTAGYLKKTSGTLKDYQEWLESTGWNTAAQVIERVALENSINPRILLTILEWECGCVVQKPMGDARAKLLESGYVLGVEDFHRKSLYGQLSWASRSLAEGYYAWRVGKTIPAGRFNNLLEAQLPASSNAGTAALVTYFTRLAESRSDGNQPPDIDSWLNALDSQAGFTRLHTEMFGDPWERDRLSGNLLPGGLIQPALILPFESDWTWSLTSGPHPAWEDAGALSALDFAPATDRSGCEPSPAWILAAADGLVVRAGNGLVIQDLDDDGYEGTGWVLVYMHVYSNERVQTGIFLRTGEPLGHPSCEGGPATGTHLHFARKYNGEWIAADGPVPFVLDGWVAKNGAKAYEGSLVRDDQVVLANVFGPATSWIRRTEADSP